MSKVLEKKRRRPLPFMNEFLLVVCTNVLADECAVVIRIRQ